MDHAAARPPSTRSKRVRAGSGAPACASSVDWRCTSATSQPTRPTNGNAQVLGSAEAQQAADQLDVAAVFREAQQLARSLGDARLAAARPRLAADALDHGRMFTSITLLESVHRDLAAHPTSEPTRSPRAHALHGRILLIGQGQECMKQLLAAKKRVPESDDDLRCHVWIDLARGEAMAHRYANAARTLSAIEKEHAVRHAPRARLRFHLYRGQLRTNLGDPEASQDLRVALEDAQRLMLPVYAGRAALFLGERAFLRGNDDDARAHFDAAVSLSQQASDPLAATLARCHLLRLGQRDASLAAQIVTLDLPELHASWLLALAGSEQPLADTADRLDALIKASDLPLALHLRALSWLERPASARALVRTISHARSGATMVPQWQGRPRTNRGDVRARNLSASTVTATQRGANSRPRPHVSSTTSSTPAAQHAILTQARDRLRRGPHVSARSGQPADLRQLNGRALGLAPPRPC